MRTCKRERERGDKGRGRAGFEGGPAVGVRTLCMHFTMCGTKWRVGDTGDGGLVGAVGWFRWLADGGGSGEVVAAKGVAMVARRASAREGKEGVAWRRVVNLSAALRRRRGRYYFLLLLLLLFLLLLLILLLTSARLCAF